MAAVEDQLYVIAGENEAGVLNTGQRYDPRSRKWSEIAQKPTPATDIRVARLGERLYVPGGRRSADQKDISAALERYDPRADRWEKLADMPQPRSGYALAALEGRLYVFGGWDGSAFRDTVFAYDPQSDNWSELEAMPTARAFADASVVEGSIFVVGGENKAGPVASNEQYVPSQEDTQPWVNRAPMPRPRSRFSSAVALSNIYVFGGDNASDTLQYDARAERWQSFEAPAVIGSQPGVTLFDEVVVIVGGRDAAGAFSTKMYSYQALFRTLLPGS
jgi:N-acetylneuraminic acid mutarotase